ncbi:ABC transporter ATP-binding protein [Microbacterium sp. A588]
MPDEILDEPVDQATVQVDDVLLSVRDLVVEYSTPGGVVQAVSGVSFDVHAGETLGVVGESGCGKSTMGRAVLRLEEITSGSVRFAGESIDSASRSTLRSLRKRMQMIFQDPIASLNPRRQVREIVVEGLKVSRSPAGHHAEVAARVLAEVGLADERYASSLPRSLSGGQAQRVAIARALALRPQLLVCDEPVSALDVSVQAQILNLLEDIKAEHNLTMIFIAHDLGVVRNVSDRIMVMYLGTICEVGEPEELYEAPLHPYTRALLDSVPLPDPDQAFAGPSLAGDVPSPLAPPTGCRFRTRCPHAQALCALEQPALREVASGRAVACHFPLAALEIPVAAGDQKGATT